MTSFEAFLRSIASEDTPRGDVAHDCLADPGFDGAEVSEYAEDLPDIPAKVLRTMVAEWRAKT
ncbi:MAG: hypothetical protein IPK93_09175 [Solirubrobacterales bacterium]|nr:hypothetical protein [Solirubrobacterales bacterium]